MQDQTSNTIAPVKSASQSPELIVTTRKEGSIALIIGIIHLIICPLVLSEIGSYIGLTEASDFTILIINAVWMLAVAASLTIFLGGFFKRSWAAFRASNKGKFVLLIVLAWVIIFVGNIIVNSLVLPALGLNLLESDTVNLQISLSVASPVLMLLMAGILAPVIEETLFRGALFGRLHIKSNILAWMVSIALFAVAHVWQFALLDPTQLICALSWIPMGVGFAFVYRRSGNVFAAITLHMLCNIIAISMQILIAPFL